MLPLAQYGLWVTFGDVLGWPECQESARGAHLGTRLGVPKSLLLAPERLCFGSVCMHAIGFYIGCIPRFLSHAGMPRESGLYVGDHAQSPKHPFRGGEMKV